jgi:hypothetical protein
MVTAMRKFQIQKKARAHTIMKSETDRRRCRHALNAPGRLCVGSLALFGAVAALGLFGVVRPVYSAEVGFLYSAGSYTTIAPADSTGTHIRDINSSGQIVFER